MKKSNNKNIFYILALMGVAFFITIAGCKKQFANSRPLGNKWKELLNFAFNGLKDQNTEGFILDLNDRKFKKKIIVLVNMYSISMSELTTMALKALPSTTVIGKRTYEVILIIGQDGYAD